MSALVGLLVCSDIAIAKERAVDFLNAVRKLGYGEEAVDYLEQLQEKKAIPEELAATFDYEMSISLRLASKKAINKRLQGEYSARAEKFLEKYLKEHPEGVGEAAQTAGDAAFENGMHKLAEARNSKDPEQQKAALAEARKAFEDARERFADAVERTKKTYSDLEAAYQAKHPEPASKGKKPVRIIKKPTKEELKELDAIAVAELAWLDARFKMARIDFHVAETMADSAEKKAHDDLLTKAAKQFNTIYQENRLREDANIIVPLYAHTWQGRCAAELGKLDEALEIYDEVLSLDTEDADIKKNKAATAGYEPLFADVNYFNLMAVLKARGVKEFGREATTWLDTHKTWNRYNGYQGVVLQLGKAQIELSEKVDDKKRKKDMITDAVKRLTDNAKIPSEHQGEINLLLRQHRKAGAAGGDPATVEEAVALAEDAVAGGDWAAATTAWQQVITLAEKKNDKKSAEALKKANESLQYAFFRIALKKFTDQYPPEEVKAKITEAFEEFDKIAREHAETNVAPVASSQAVKAALTLYAGARAEKNQEALDAALERLQKAADYTQSKWPDRAEADDARISLGQASLVRGELADAITVFERVNPKSDRYPAALYLAGQTHWQIYTIEKRKPADEHDTAGMADHLTKAQERLTSCLEAYKKLHSADGADATPDASQVAQQNEAQVRLGEVLVEAGKGAEAVSLLDPQIEAIKAAKPPGLDTLMLRTFLTSVKANLAAGQLNRASDVATTLTDLGPDTEAINLVLNSFVRMLHEEAKRAQIEADQAHAGTDPVAEQKAEARLTAIKELLGQLLERLSKREQYKTEHKMYIADTSAYVGRSDVARDLYSQVLKLADADPEFSAKNEGQLIRIRANLVGLLRQKGEYAEAKAEIETLLEKKPGAVPLMMERGRILQSWAHKDPSKWEDAASLWTSIRTKLGTKKPPEYYEAIYNAAYCLSVMGEKDKVKKTQALQLLNAIYKLDGKLKTLPEWQEKYKTLIDRLTPPEDKKTTTAAAAKK